MITRDSEFTDLTKAEVEALLECFDFLRNGYVQVIDYNSDGVWFIRMKHAKNGARLDVSISRQSYTIFKDGKPVKLVHLYKDHNLYGLVVNSDMSVGVYRQTPRVDQKLVPT